MDEFEDAVPVDEINSVDPELKAHITSLVSALGGPDLTEQGRPYVLGDEALACLRDIKRWIKQYDERMNRWDIARAVSETSLMTFDLLEILTKWELDCENGNNTKLNDRIALAALELMVPLTWPLELVKGTSTNNHYRHAAYLFRARLRYKKAILGHPKKRVLKAVIRLAIPVLKLDKADRTVRDESILKLVIYFFRNIMAIETPPTQQQRVEDDVSRSNTISAFDDQNVVAFLVTIASQIGNLFTVQDTPILECIFHMLKGLQARDIFPSPTQEEAESRQQKQPNDLQGILKKEKVLKKEATRGATRHSRFGTMVSMVAENGQRFAVSGPDGLASTASTLNKLDENKKWRKPNTIRMQPGEGWNHEVPLTKEAKTIVDNFVRDFLDSGFNPVFGSIRRLIETENDRATTENHMQFLYLVGFFLECERRKREIQSANFEQESDYGLVANTLNQNMFIVVMKLMRESHERGPMQNFQIVYAAMVCFTEILKVVHQMEKSISEDDQELAHNMKLRLFYEEHSLQLLSKLPRLALRQSLEFLNQSVELTAIVLKMLESFSKEHTALYVRSKRKSRKKKGKSQDHDLDADQNPEGYAAQDAEDYADMNSDEESQTVTRERKFEFARFERKYVNSETLDAYKRYLASYREMSSTEIMTGLWFIHRMFTHKESRVHFFSLDFMRLLQKMTDSRDGVPKTYKVRREIDRFMAYYVSKLREALDRTPSLYVELLFNKMPEHVFYFQHGYDQVKTTSSKKASTVAPKWEFKADMSLTEEQQHGILIAALIDDDLTPHVEWLTDQMSSIIDGRQKAGGTNNQDVKLEGDEENLRLTKRNGKTRLLLELLGFVIPETMEEDCIMPRYIDLEKLETGLKYLRKYLFEPFSLEQDPDSVAGDFIQREGMSEVVEEIRTTKRKRSAKPPKRRNRKAIASDDEDNDDNDQNVSAKPKIFQPSKQYKSADFIQSDDDLSDDERDAEFFANEQKLRDEILSKLDTTQAVIPNKEDADRLYSGLLSNEWQRPDDDDKIVAPTTQIDDAPSDEESLFVGGDNVPQSLGFEDEEEEESIPSTKRTRRIIIDDDDN